MFGKDPYQKQGGNYYFLEGIHLFLLFQNVENQGEICVDFYRKSIGGEGYLAQIPETEAFGRGRGDLSQILRSDDGFPINPSSSKTVKSRTALLNSLIQIIRGVLFI